MRCFPQPSPDGPVDNPNRESSPLSGVASTGAKFLKTTISFSGMQGPPAETIAISCLPCRDSSRRVPFAGKTYWHECQHGTQECVRHGCIRSAHPDQAKPAQADEGRLHL